MTAVQPLLGQSANSGAAGGVSFASIQAKLAEAAGAPNLTTKRALFEEAFQVLKQEANQGPLSSEQQKQLFTLFDNYAYDTLYNQGSEGYRKSACLLELSLVLQLRTLGLVDAPAEWKEASSLDELLKTLNFAEGQKGRYHDPVIQFLPAPQVLSAKAQEQGLQEILAQTLIHLSFSYQNIDLFTEPPNLAFHKKMNDLTVALIGEGNEEAQDKLADFSYNRCGFLLEQGGVQDVQTKIDAYDRVLEQTQRAFTTNPKLRESRIAQIEFMQARVYATSGAPDALLQKAEPLFRKAFERRKPLLGQFPTDKENFDQHFLLTNTRTGLIKCCLAKGDLNEATLHAGELKAFLAVLEQRDNNHAYSETYRGLIRLVDAAVAAGKK